MAMKVHELSRKFIKPSIPTPATLRHHKIGLIDESAPLMNVNIVLFFSINRDDNPKFVSRLEKSLEKTLTQFRPFAGRYDAKIRTVDCNDHGAEFINAGANLKLEDILNSEGNSKLIDKFIPCKLGDADEITDPILSTQVTSFQCGGLALGVSIAHRIVDAATLSTFLNQWATMTREENEADQVYGSGFYESSFFPACGLPPFEVGLPRSISEEFLSKNVTRKVSFSESMISNLKAQIMLNEKKGNHHWSKVQLVSSIIWKALIGVDRAIHNHRRNSILIQALNLRGKTASLIPKHSCGNLYVLFATESGEVETAQGLAYLLSDSVKEALGNYSNLRHEREEGQKSVLNSFSEVMNNYDPGTENVILVTSWCKFPFYEANFGFGKPIWVTNGSMAIKNSVILIDDAGGNGVDAYVCMEVKGLRYFEEALDLNAFAA